MNQYRLGDLLDMRMLQTLADSNFRASGIPITIIDGIDQSVLIDAGWTEICDKFHRVCVRSEQRCRQSDCYASNHLGEAEVFQYKCRNGLWHIAIPIMVADRHLATLFLSQFFFAGEMPDREYLTRQALEFGYNLDAYFAAIDAMPTFSPEKVKYIVDYDKALVKFIADLAEQSLRVIKTKESLISSEEKYRTLVHNVNIGLYRSTVSGKFIQANPAMASILGYDSVEELIQVDASATYKMPADLTQCIEELRSNGFVKGKELAMLKKDGTHIWCLATISALFDDETGEIVLMDGAIEDITERKRAEHALIESHGLLNAIVESTSDIVFVKDLQGRYLISNAAGARFLGKTVDEVIGKYSTEFLAPDTARTIMENERQVMESGHPQVFEETLTAAVTRTFLSSRGIYRNADGSVKGHISILSDITEMKQMEGQLEKAKNMEVIGQLAAGVAHEVRNPLNAILSIFEALFKETKIKEDPEFQPYVHHIRIQVNRLAKLMTDLLDLGKPVHESNLVSVPLYELCKNSVDLWKSNQLQDAARLVFNNKVSRSKVLVDSSRMQQVLFNLMDNAAQNSPEGSEIVMQILDSGRDTAKVRIIDTGKGIPSDKIARVTEPFFTMRKGGTGLGLTLVKHFLEAMQAEFRIWNNAPPPGCTAEISLKLEGDNRK